MKKLLSAMVMVMFLVGFTGSAFADEMKGDHKDMKTEKKDEKKTEKKDEKKAEKKEKKK